MSKPMADLTEEENEALMIKICSETRQMIRSWGNEDRDKTKRRIQIDILQLMVKEEKLSLPLGQNNEHLERNQSQVDISYPEEDSSTSIKPSDDEDRAWEPAILDRCDWSEKYHNHWRKSPSYIGRVFTKEYKCRYDVRVSVSTLQLDSLVVCSKVGTESWLEIGSCASKIGVCSVSVLELCGFKYKKPMLLLV